MDSSSALNFLPWVEKYRPEKLEDVLSHQDNVDTIKRYMKSNQIPHLLFHGPPGTGKTSTILAIARTIYGSAYKSYVLELNASDDRRITTVREQIKVFSESKGSFAGFHASTRDAHPNENTCNNNGVHPEESAVSEESRAAKSVEKQVIAGEGVSDEAKNEEGAAAKATVNELPSQHAHTHTNEKSNASPFTALSFKLIILDEADQMTGPAQNALRRIMELYSRNVRFCIICNYLNKINPALQSRCTCFRFAPVKDDAVRDKVSEVAMAEKARLSPEGLEAVLSIGRGDFRRILNCLQVVCMGNEGKMLDENVVFSTLGLPTPSEIEKIFGMLMELPFDRAFTELQELMKNRGYAVQDFVTAIYNHSLKIDWPNSVIIQLITRLADIEERLAAGANEDIQLAAFASTFVNVRFDLEDLKNRLKMT